MVVGDRVGFASGRYVLQAINERDAENEMRIHSPLFDASAACVPLAIYLDSSSVVSTFLFRKKTAANEEEEERNVFLIATLPIRAEVANGGGDASTTTLPATNNDFLIQPSAPMSHSFVRVTKFLCEHTRSSPRYDKFIHEAKTTCSMH